MKKSLLACLFACLIFSIPSVAQYHINYDVKGLKPAEVYLSSIKGSSYTPIDSVYSENEQIKFNIPETLPVGIYRISFGKNLFTDVVLNHENVVMQNDLESMLDKLEVIESEENKIYYDYWRTSLYINDSIDLISKIGQKLFEANNKVMTHDLDSMASKAYYLDKYLETHTLSLLDKSKGMYVHKLLNAYLEPNYEAYKKQADAIKYKTRRAYLKEHFFDRIDFTDSTLLNSEVFYVLCTDYLTKYVVEEESDSNYIRAVDLILKKTTPDSPVYKYILYLLIDTYEDTPWEATYIHLVDDYLLKNTCEQTSSNQSIAQRAAIMKTLKPGLPATDFTLQSSLGNPINLYSVQAKAVLLLFWSSTCPHCEKVMPQLLDVYQQYHALGLEIVAVSLDTDKKSWLNAIAKNQMKWINVSDLKGIKSYVIKSYNANSTPTFFLLDADKKIIKHPYSPDELMEGLEGVFKK